MRARVWARVRAHRKPSQDGAGAAVLGSVASSSPAHSGRTEDTKSRVLAAAGRAPLGELRRIESWSRAEFVAHGVEETGSPGKCACVRARRIRRRSGVCALLCLQMAMYILCKLLSRVQLYQESANIQAVCAAGAFLCNFVSVHCLSSTSRRPKFVVCVSDPASWSSV